MTVLCAVIFSLISAVLEPLLATKFGKSHWATKLSEALSFHVVIVIVLTAGHLLINNTLWRIENPELDFGGDWAGLVTYDRVQVGNAPETMPFTGEIEVRIDQDCHEFALAPAKGGELINYWRSLAANLENKDTVSYAYVVCYSDQKRFPARARGFEDIHVTKRDADGRPIELIGEFFHCAEGQTPVYNGKVVFTRKTNAGSWPLVAIFLLAAIPIGIGIWLRFIRPK